MGIGLTTSATSVSISGSVAAALPQNSSTQSIWNHTADITANTTTTLKTMGAGKTGYIKKIVVNISSNAGAGATCDIRVGGSTIHKGYIYQNAANSYPKEIILDIDYCIRATAAQTIQIVTTNIAGTITASVWGYEV
jgi:hypothetical protein